MEPTKEGGASSAVKAVAGPVVQIDEGRIQAHLGEVVRSTVEETLNALLDAEADRLCEARKYERSEGRNDTHGGSLSLVS
jgi:putative transposase